MRISLALALLVPFFPSLTRSVHHAGTTDWPQFRGANGTGVVPKADIPLEWSETKNVAWKVALPGSGWSQPVVIGKQVYVTAAVGQGLERPMGFAKGVDDPRTRKAGTAPDAKVDWQVLALDLDTGKILWTQTAVSGKPKFPIHPSNTYATETAAAGVYAFFGATGTAVGYDPSGKQLWKQEFGAHATMQGYGTASSPALYDGKLYVQCFDDDEALLVCLGAKSGKEVWRVKRDKPGTSWASPLVWHNQKRVEIVVSTSRLITSHDPATGKELWRAGGVDGPGMSSFGADAERIYFGQRSPMGSPPLYAIPAGVAGDLSPAKGSTDVKNQAWAEKASAPNMSSPVASEGLLYVLGEGLLSCHDAASGERIYKERLGENTIFAASPIIVGDKLLVLDESGTTSILDVGPDFKVLGTPKLDDTFWTTPSVAGNALLLRGVDHLYCIRK